VEGWRDLAAGLDTARAGAAMHAFIRDLYPICRSITGDGLRETLRRVGQAIPLTLHEVSTGTPAYDWSVPHEWNIRDAYIKNPAGDRIVDFHKSNLHVVNYSVPVHRRMSLAELRPHLHSLPDHPEWVPYRTSYYRDAWGFCLPHRQLLALPEGEYEVCIDSTLAAGSLSYGECLLPGAEAGTVLLSAHACHPALCNDNLSGVALLVALARHLQARPLRYSYRFVFAPGTIGAIVWLSRNESEVQHIRHGLVVACVGDPGPFHYKRSRRGSADIDRAAVRALQDAGRPFEVLDFSPYGYDERQYCSPGFDLPVGSLTRTPHGRFPEYHTSADDPTLVQAEALGDSLAQYLRVLSVLESNRRYRNTNPKCEPQLGRRGLYPLTGGRADSEETELAVLWVLNLSDGRHDLLDICGRSGLSFPVVAGAAHALRQVGLLVPCEPETPTLDDATCDGALIR